jgi:hypothetical protein
MKGSGHSNLRFAMQHNQAYLPLALWLIVLPYAVFVPRPDLQH